eukprot:358538-Chlamydomonas_euryale.AAC.3
MRDSTPPRSGTQLPRAFPTSRGALEVSVPTSPAQLSSHGAATRDAAPCPPSSMGFAGQGQKSKCHAA